MYKNEFLDLKFHKNDVLHSTVGQIFKYLFLPSEGGGHIVFEGEIKVI